jgi:hypothetical protein
LAGVKAERGNIILLHDAGGDTREETVKAENFNSDYIAETRISFYQSCQYFA